MRHKNDTMPHFLSFCESATRQHPDISADNLASIRMDGGDKGGEFSMRASLHARQLSGAYWSEALLCSVETANRLPTTGLPNQKSPCKSWYGHQPALQHLRTFGSSCYAYQPQECRPEKLSRRGIHHKFLSYGSSTGVYRLLSPKIRVVLTKHVLFNETSVVSSSPGFFSSGVSNDVCNSDDVPTPSADSSPTDSCESSDLSDQSSVSSDSSSFCPDVSSEVLHSELNSLANKDSYTLVDLPPPGANVIGTRWVLSKEIDADGHLVKHKGRLVAQGYSQKYGVDFTQRYSPIVNAASLRLLLAVSANKGYAVVDSLDISTVFLNGDIDGDVYVR
ncbi:unnamed protein product [Heterosigma akashiwo]